MGEYDSILKEKKVYQDPEVHHSKYTKYVILDIVAVFLVLVISYVVYFQTVLSGEQIFLQDISKISKEYSTLLNHLPILFSETNYSVEGTFNLGGELDYSYDVIRDQEEMKIQLESSDSMLTYYVNQTGRYVKTASLTEAYVKLNSTSILNGYWNLVKNFQNYMNVNQYIKKFYLNGKIPIVEVNVVLKSEDIKKIVGDTTMAEDDLELMFTFQNHALTNEIVSMKVVVNQVSKNTREVYFYRNGEIEYTDNEGKVTKLSLGTRGEDFTLKIYRDDILYSVFTGTNMENRYEYAYQIIDQVYNLRLLVEKNNLSYVVEFSSNRELDGEIQNHSVHLTMNYQEDGILEEDVRQSKLYSSLTEDEQRLLDQELNVSLNSLREFIEQYQKGVDQVDDDESNG